MLSGSIDWGTLGHASLFHGRATVGVMLNRLEVFTGYDYLKLAAHRCRALWPACSFTSEVALA